jgi:hypothetical protein
MKHAKDMHLSINLHIFVQLVIETNFRQVSTYNYNNHGVGRHFGIEVEEWGVKDLREDRLLFPLSFSTWCG